MGDRWSNSHSYEVKKCISGGSPVKCSICCLMGSKVHQDAN